MLFCYFTRDKTYVFWVSVMSLVTRDGLPLWKHLWKEFDS